MLWKIAPTSLMKRDLPPALPLWDQRRRPAWTQRVINLLNSAISLREIHLVHAAAILEISCHSCRSPLREASNVISPFLGHCRPFSFTMLEITPSPNPRFLSYGRGWSYILMGNHVGISIPTIWWEGLSIKTDANEQGVFSHYYFLNDYWNVVRGCVPSPPPHC